MPTYFQRPENALKRANELIAVGKKDRALESLYDVIKSKKHRTWQKIHMQIMDMYVQLCVELKKSHIAKEGLYQYKNICQQVNIKSLEDVIRKYLSLAEEKTEAARKESHQSVVDVDDLDVLLTPEKLLLSAVSGEDTQDRADRTILTPWVKFLWESYRQCLDLLRNNNNVEKLYHEVAQQAFQFCKKYERKTEFRKLCDNLRTHLSHVYKHQNNQRAINLNNPDSQAMHQETRLTQLESAIQMELWQEAFKAVEDLHGLIMLTKKPSLLANYYQKLALVFWNSDNQLFHACSYLRLFHLTREQRKNLSSEDLQKLANRVLCATLAIPLAPARNQIDVLLDMDDTASEKQRRLATLIGLQNPPTRPQLVKDLVKYSVVQLAHPELQNFYKYLEVEFSPLKLSSRVASSLEFITGREELAQYIPALQHVTVTRLLKQVSQVYSTMEFDHLLGLIPFANRFSLEKVIVDAARNLELQVRIDHKSRSLQFGGDLYVAQKDDIREGPQIQSLTSEQIRYQLSQMATALKKASDILRPKSEIEKNEELRLHIVQTYRQVAKKEHARILQRRQIIEERKEELEILNQQREREEQEQLEMELEEQSRLEFQRREREIEERQKMKKEEEHSEIKKKVARERLQQLRNTEVGAKAFANLNEEEIAEMDVDDILAKQVEQLEKERREMQERLKVQEKKVDYFERAKRLEEIPLLEKAYEEERVKAKVFWEQQEKEKIERQKEDRKLALEHRDRLARMKKDQEAFLDQLKEKRKHKYQEELARFELFLKEERLKRLTERKRKRKEERRYRWQKEKEEEEQRQKEEVLRKQQEEKDRLAREKKEKEDSEYREKKRKLDEIAEKQRQREREIEEKAKKPGPTEEKEAEKPGAWRPKTGGWREKEASRLEGRAQEKAEEGEDKSWRHADSGRDRAPARDAEPKGERRWRDDREDGDRRHDDERDDDKRPTPRDEGGRRDFDRRGPPRDDFERSRVPPRDEERRYDDRRDERRGPGRDEYDRRDDDRRGPQRDDFDRRGPRDDDRRGFRDDDRRGPRDDDRRGPPRDDDRRGPFRDDRRRDFDSDKRRDDDFDRRPAGRDDDRRGPPRGGEGGSWRGGQRGEEPRDDRRRDDRDRLPPRDDRRRDDRDRLPLRDDRDRRDDRPPPRDDRDRRDDRQYGRDDRDRPYGRDDRDRPSGRDADERGGDGWRKGDSRGDERKSGGGRGGDDGWRKGGDDKRDDKGARDVRAAPPRVTDDRKLPRGKEEGGEEDDGWTTVRR